jgi:gamma-glutamyltranspeptidase/glutathione hydrolase
MSTRYLQVITPRAMVASAHYLASQAGVWALRQGGNAVDAAVCAAATIAVVAPHATGVGGDLFAMVWPAGSDEPIGLNASGRAPRAASRARLRAMGYERMPQRGGLSITVPGAVSGWVALLERYGTRRLVDLLEPAIDYARHGAPVTANLARAIAMNTEMLAADPSSRRIFFRDGRPLQEGERFINPALAESLRQIGATDGEALYHGPLAEALAAGIQAAGGLITVEDLAAHRAEWVVPIAVNFKGADSTPIRIYELPPNTQGATVLEMLNMLAYLMDGDHGPGLGNTSLRHSGHNTAPYIDALVRVKQLAYADRDAYLTDPEFADIPLQQLISTEYAARRLQESDSSPAPSEAHADGDTVYLCAVDQDGTAISLIQSMYQGFGSGVIAGDTGIALQNRGAYFSLDERHPNRLEPGKRTLHTLIPAMAGVNGQPTLIFGSMGGDGQPQFQVQILLNHLLFGMPIQAAIEAPRFLHGSAAGSSEVWNAQDVDHRSLLLVEERFDQTVIDELRRMGYTVQIVEGWSPTMGHAQAIALDRDRTTLWGGADPRGDGLALGY